MIYNIIIVDHHPSSLLRRNPFDRPRSYKVPFVISKRLFYHQPPPVPLNNSVKIGSTIESSLGMRKKTNPIMRARRIIYRFTNITIILQRSLQRASHIWAADVLSANNH